MGTTDHASTDPIFNQLWEANQAAFDGGDHETACHSLQAALARAHFLHDGDLVRAVGQKAIEQHQQLYQQAPGDSYPVRVDPHPTREDAIEMVYGSLVRQARTLTVLLGVDAGDAQDG